MTATIIPNSQLLDAADEVTVWVAKHDAPTDMWTLREAIVWAMRQPGRESITLFRPPGGGVCAAWIEFSQIQRLGFALGVEPSSSAA